MTTYDPNTGRDIRQTNLSNYRPLLWISSVIVAIFVIGLVALYWGVGPRDNRQDTYSRDNQTITNPQDPENNEIETEEAH